MRGPVRTCLDAFGHVRIRLEVFGSVGTFSEFFRFFEHLSLCPNTGEANDETCAPIASKISEMCSLKLENNNRLRRINLKEIGFSAEALERWFVLMDRSIDQLIEESNPLSIPSQLIVVLTFSFIFQCFRHLAMKNQVVISLQYGRWLVQLDL